MNAGSFSWPTASIKLEGTGPTIDLATIVPETAVEELQPYLNTPNRLAGWFGLALDATRKTVTIGCHPHSLTITRLAIATDRTTFGGITGSGVVRGHIRLRPVITSPPPNQLIGHGTEIWVYMDLPEQCPAQLVQLVSDVTRRGLHHIRSELAR